MAGISLKIQKSLYLDIYYKFYTYVGTSNFFYN